MHDMNLKSISIFIFCGIINMQSFVTSRARDFVHENILENAKINGKFEFY